MNKTLKWILGIVAALLVLAVIAGVVFFVAGHWGGARWMMGARSSPFFDDRYGRRFMMPMGHGWFPMMRFGGFFPLGLLFGGLFWGLVTFLVVLGVISLFRGRKSAGQTVVSATPAAPVAPPVETHSQSVVHVCSNCGRAVQEDWEHCPYCGNKLE